MATFERWAWGDAPDWFEKIRNACYSAIGTALLTALVSLLSTSQISELLTGSSAFAGALLEFFRQYLRSRLKSQ